MPIFERNVFVSDNGDQVATAQALLAAAEAADLDPSVVQVLPGFQGFIVPPAIASGGEGLALVITEPTDGAQVDPLTPIRGNAPAGSTVDLYMDSAYAGQDPVSTVEADGDGAFEFVGSTPLEVSPEGIAVGVGPRRSSKVTVTLAPAKSKEKS